MSRAVVITGASRGIGAACAVAFAKAGWDVGLIFRSDERSAADVAREVEQFGVRSVVCRADVTDEQQISVAFRHIVEVVGRIDALVNNAGIAPIPSAVVDMDAARVRSVLDVNVVGAFICVREAIRLMSTRDGGAGGVIVNVSSGAAQVGSPGEFVDYAASKAAVETLTVGLAKEVGSQGIRVNAVRPGVIQTDIHERSGQPDKPARLKSTVPIGRIGTSEDVAAAIKWLCSDEAAYVSGAILSVTGGR